MNKIFTIAFFMILFISFIPQRSFASHLVGAEISWKYLGSDTFLISAIIERDCNGVPMPDQPFTVVPCGTQNGVYINTLKTGGQDITPVCKNYCTRCSESSCDFPDGFENYIFSAKVNLKAIDDSCCAFKIVWQACCRNGAITTGSAGENYYLEATMNPCLNPGDNSPVFSNAPLMLAEIGQCLTYTFAATDVDMDANGFHDSLVYKLDTPYQAANQPVTFIQPYAYNHPILYYGSSPNDPWYPDCKGFHLDPTTGDLMFKATKEDITQVVVRVEEWGKDNNGKPYKKGETRRDVTFFTTPSTGDQVPALSGFNGSENFAENFCVGQKKCLQAFSSDADTSNILNLSVSGFPAALSNATLAFDTSSKTPSAYFCWQPDSSQAGNTYQFIINASDNNCPLVGKTARTYTVHVYLPPKASVSATNLGCGNVQYIVVPQHKTPIINYSWSGADGLTGADTILNHHYHNSGLYNWKLIYTANGGCADSSIGQVLMSSYVHNSVSPKDTLVCLSDGPALTLKNSASGGIGPYTYSWKSAGIDLNDSTDILKFQVTKDSVIIAYVLDNGSHCTNWDTSRIRASAGTTPVSLLPPKDTLACMGQKITLIAEATGGDPSHYSFLWKPAGVQSNTYSFIATAAQTQLISLTDGCSSDSATVHVNVRAPLLVTLPKDTSTCLGQSVTVTATGTGGIPANYLFTWEGSLGTGANKSIKPAFSQLYSVVLSDGCSTPDTGLIKINIHPVPVSVPSAQQTTIVQNQSVQFQNASSGAVQYVWRFGDGSTSNIDTPIHQYTDTGFFNVTLIATSSYGCIDSAVLKRYIHVLPAYYCYIPNAFTPNRDFLNECFGPKGQAIQGYTLEIFSRWGNTVYKGNSCWDGNFNGLTLSDGMFIYHLSVTDTYGGTHYYSGHFYLLN